MHFRPSVIFADFFRLCYTTDSDMACQRPTLWSHDLARSTSAISQLRTYNNIIIIIFRFLKRRNYDALEVWIL